jgi:hypothetical protein
MKRLLLIFALLLSIVALADMPGNKPRPSGTFMVVNASAFPAFRFSLSPNYGDTLYWLRDSTLIHMPGGRGAPMSFSFQVSRADSGKTYNLGYFTSINGHVILRIDSVVNDSVVKFTRLDSPSKRNEGFGVTGTQEPLSPGMQLLPVLGAAALVALLAWWVRRRYLRSGEVVV